MADKITVGDTVQVSMQLFVTSIIKISDGILLSGTITSDSTSNSQNTISISGIPMWAVSLPTQGA